MWKCAIKRTRSFRKESLFWLGRIIKSLSPHGEWTPVPRLADSRSREGTLSVLTTTSSYRWIFCDVRKGPGYVVWLYGCSSVWYRFKQQFVIHCFWSVRDHEFASFSYHWPSTEIWACECRAWHWQWVSKSFSEVFSWSVTVSLQPCRVGDVKMTIDNNLKMLQWDIVTVLCHEYATRLLAPQMHHRALS